MSRALHPAGWQPGCWTAFAISCVAVAVVVSHFSIGTP